MPENDIDSQRLAKAKSFDEQMLDHLKDAVTGIFLLRKAVEELTAEVSFISPGDPPDHCSKCCKE